MKNIILKTILLSSISFMAVAAEKDKSTSNIFTSAVSPDFVDVTSAEEKFPVFTSADFLKYLETIILALPEEQVGVYRQLPNYGIDVLFHSRFFYFGQSLNIEVLKRALFGVPIDGVAIPTEALLSLLNLYPNQEDAQKLLYDLRANPIGKLNLVDSDQAKNVIDRALRNSHKWAIKHYENLDALPEEMPTGQLLILANHGNRAASDKLDELYEIEIPSLEALSKSEQLQAMIDALVEKVTPYSYGTPLVILGNRLSDLKFGDLAKVCYLAAARLGSIEGAEYYYNELNPLRQSFSEIMDDVITLSMVGLPAKESLLYFVSRGIRRLRDEYSCSNPEKCMEFMRLMAKHGSDDAILFLADRLALPDSDSQLSLLSPCLDSEDDTVKIRAIIKMISLRLKAKDLIGAGVFYNHGYRVLVDKDDSPFWQNMKLSFLKLQDTIIACKRDDVSRKSSTSSSSSISPQDAERVRLAQEQLLREEEDKANTQKNKAVEARKNKAKRKAEAERMAEAERVAKEKSTSTVEQLFAQAVTFKNGSKTQAKDPKKALDLFLRISVAGTSAIHIEATKEASDILMQQGDVSKVLTLQRIIELFGDENSSRTASYVIGHILRDSLKHSPQNDSLAYSAFKRAADLGHVKAQYEAAMTVLTRNINVPNPLDLSLNLLQTAANFGHVDAYAQLYWLVRQGTATQPARPALAAQYLERYRQLAMQPDSGELHQEALTLIKDAESNRLSIFDTLEKLDRAADLGSAESAYIAGLIRSGLYWPNFPLAYDQIKAQQSFERGAELGDRNSKFELALLLNHIDRDRSIALLEELLASGNTVVKPYLQSIKELKQKQQ